MIPRFLVLAAVLVIPVLLAVASQAMTRPPGPPDLPDAPIEVSFAPPASPASSAPSGTADPSGAPGTPSGPPPSAGPSAGLESLEPGVIRTPRPTVDDDDDDVGDTDEDD